MFTRILVPTDGSELSIKAPRIRIARRALALARS
jgi:hypothetical protein